MFQHKQSLIKKYSTPTTNMPETSCLFLTQYTQQHTPNKLRNYLLFTEQTSSKIQNQVFLKNKEEALQQD